uniref:Adaptor related protein complex 1 subunit sigma 1 n=1 Tax=Sarcophilus harrisii TaxID=9305 RepID=A0A7N4Q1U6_SARHA
MRFMLLFSRQGKLRLQKWYLAMSDKERKKMVRELMQVVLARKPKMCSFLEWRDLKVVYKRYASLYFCCAIEGQDNELITLELIHRYVELLDKYFGSVCELDIIFNFEKAYFILDEFLMGGDVQDTSKKSVLKAIEQADLLQEVWSGSSADKNDEVDFLFCTYLPLALALSCHFMGILQGLEERETTLWYLFCSSNNYSDQL